MVYVFITLASVALILFILSFFMNDRIKEVEEQVEQLSITMMQEQYQMKQKVSILEEELLAEDLTEEILKQPYSKEQSTELPLVQTINSMYKRGFKPNYIAKKTGLSEHDVYSIIQQFSTGGNHK